MNRMRLNRFHRGWLEAAEIKPEPTRAVTICMHLARSSV
jgi:hypothetical protein